MEKSSEYALEFACTRLDKINKRLSIMLVVAIILIVLSNAAWLWAWMQYDYVGEEVTYSQDGHGTNIIGNRNEVQCDVAEANSQNAEKEEKGKFKGR